MRPRRIFVSFFGLGSPTAAPILYRYIKEHPAACVTESTRFFSDTAVFAKGIAWYEARFTAAKPEMLRGELATDYLSHTPAAALIARVYPSTKLLAVIDNPLVSVRIDFINAVRSRKINRHVTLAEFLKLHPEVLARARYGRQLVPYYSYYASTDFLVCLVDDIAADPLRMVKVVYEHLGLPVSFVPLSLRHLVVEEIDDKHKPGFFKRRLMALRKLVRSGYGYFMKRFKAKPPSAETVSQLAHRLQFPPELEAELKDYFRDDVRQLSDLLHRNLLVEWGFGE